MSALEFICPVCGLSLTVRRCLGVADTVWQCHTCGRVFGLPPVPPPKKEKSETSTYGKHLPFQVEPECPVCGQDVRVADPITGVCQCGYAFSRLPQPPKKMEYEKPEQPMKTPYRDSSEPSISELVDEVQRIKETYVSRKDAEIYDALGESRLRNLDIGLKEVKSQVHSLELWTIVALLALVLGGSALFVLFLHESHLTRLENQIESLQSEAAVQYCAPPEENSEQRNKQ